MEHVDYMPLFLIVAGIMIIALCIVMFAVDEAKFSLEMKEYENAHPEENLAETDSESEEEKLPVAQLASRIGRRRTIQAEAKSGSEAYDVED